MASKWLGDRRSARAAIGAVLVGTTGIFTIASACSSSDDANSSNGAATQSGSGTGTSSGTSGAQGGEGGNLLDQDGGGTGASTGTSIDPDAACATSATEATLVPVNMFIMFDKSGSMNDASKWTNATAALKAFFQDPATAGLRVALRFFPDLGCDGTTCDIDVCSQPLVDVGALTADPAPMDVQEQALVTAVDSHSPSGGTPMFAALGGAEKWAATYQALHPTEKVVVILVTDGEPNGCDEDITNISQLAADALATSAVSTYAVGLAGSNEGQMNQIAVAGGSMQGFFIGNGNAEADLIAALKAIQGSQVACEFQMPQGTPDNPVDPAKVNVNYTPGDGGAMETIGQVDSEADCTAQKGGWYYDDMQKPTKITLCPSTCTDIQADDKAKIAILLGCATTPVN